MLILGIESSCDETAVSVVTSEREVLSHALRSQYKAHAPYGGVVPEIAARQHIACIDILYSQALEESGCALTEMDAIAATVGPGLIGGLYVGASFAKALALVSGKPFFAVNHLEGHGLAARLCDASLDFPYLLLLASGGHCLLVRVEGVGRYALYGETLDDAPGETFDKSAILLGLGAPGGPKIEALARTGDATRYSLPLPLIGKNFRGANRPERATMLDFSFSGLKTAVRRIGLSLESSQDKADLAACLQSAIAEIFADRCAKGLERFFLETGERGPLVLSGGVMANETIRKRLQAVAEDSGARLCVPPARFCVDNAAMIAWAALERMRLGEGGDALDFSCRPRWPLRGL